MCGAGSAEPHHGQRDCVSRGRLVRRPLGAYRRRCAGILLLADLVVYLQVILFFQKKDRTTYWMLVIISLLEVVVAAWFNQGAMFGVVLGIYMLTGLSALALLFLYGNGAATSAAQAAAAAATPGSRWPLAEQSTLATATVGSSHAGVVRELFVRLAMLAVGTLVLAAVIFFSVPRRGLPAWRGAC